MTTMTTETGYPITVTFTPPERTPRWIPFFGVLAAIPHFIVLYVLNIAAGVCVFIAWFAGVFAGRIPQGLLGFIVGVTRYQVRVQSWVLFMRGDYPSFGLDTGAADAGSDPVVRIDAVFAEKRRRLTIFFRFLLVIPQLIVMWFVFIAAYVCVVISWFAVIITGHWPRALQNFVLGAMRWSARVGLYSNLVTDKYPPFGLH